MGKIFSFYLLFVCRGKHSLQFCACSSWAEGLGEWKEKKVFFFSCVKLIAHELNRVMCHLPFQFYPSQRALTKELLVGHFVSLFYQHINKGMMNIKPRWTLDNFRLFFVGLCYHYLTFLSTPKQNLSKNRFLKLPPSSAQQVLIIRSSISLLALL